MRLCSPREDPTLTPSPRPAVPTPMAPDATAPVGDAPPAAEGTPEDEAPQHEGEAVSYSRGTPEWKILNKRLGSPPLLVRRADAHQPATRDAFKRALEFYGKVVPEVQHGLPFPYSKLEKDEIRILRLYQSKHPDDPLKADLFKRKLKDVKGEYEALSYCWGTEGPTHEIQIRDLNASTAVLSESSPRRAGQGASPGKAWREAVGAITHTEFKIRKNLFDAFETTSKKVRRRIYLGGCHMHQPAPRWR